MDCDVLIIGGGPVGVSALALLGKAGISAIGIERETAVWSQARAVHFDGEAMRCLQSLGVADEAMAVCKPMESLRMENEAHETLFAYPTGLFGSQGWHDDIMFHQPEMETLIRRKLDTLPGIELRSGTTFIDYELVAGGVRCTVSDPDSGTYTLTSRWVIAADGATSTVRRLAGIETEKMGKDDPWLVVDGILPLQDGKHPIDGDMVFLAHYSRPALWVRLPGERIRMEFKVMPEDDPAEIVTPEALERISQGKLPVSRFAPDRIAIYTFRARVAKQWRVGNIFLAGDAAHQAPPLYGQGLCAGMRDVMNLVWKIDLVTRGLAPESLLDTYETERKTHAQYWVEQASNIAEIVQTTDAAVAAHRDRHIREHPHSSAPPPAPPLGPGLHTGDRDPRAGKLSAQPLLSDNKRLDDEVGPQFLVAAPTEFLDRLSPTLRTALDANNRITVLSEPAIIDGLTDSAGAAVVLRPDRYILGVADDATEFASIITRIPTLERSLDPDPITAAAP
jgi:3-(3-hydroxy-phenyl)propionate hydroxylase